MSVPEALKNHFCSEISQLAHDAWLCGLFAAKNGNISQKMPDPYDEFLLITAQGTCKGHLKNADFCLFNMKEGTAGNSSPISSETQVHLAIYDTCQCQAVVHCHPPKLLAWEIIAKGRSLLDLPLYEAKMWKDAITRVKACQPGTRELAEEVKKASQDLIRKNPQRASSGGVWMDEHGLCTWGTTLQEAFAVCEEMEHLAHIALMTAKV
ncbi:MAG: class II aldolase/adducin family protein [Lachnospiraceae bacterium]|nr:class II aldolase/adducin family protein [Lachnospiraceae bacterium]